MAIKQASPLQHRLDRDSFLVWAPYSGLKAFTLVAGVDPAQLAFCSLTFPGWSNGNAMDQSIGCSFPSSCLVSANIAE
jgi:hypothetical protein